MKKVIFTFIMLLMAGMASAQCEAPKGLMFKQLVDRYKGNVLSYYGELSWLETSPTTDFYRLRVIWPDGSVHYTPVQDCSVRGGRLDITFNQWNWWGVFQDSSRVTVQGYCGTYCNVWTVDQNNFSQESNEVLIDYKK